jgi:arylsulfatase A-like enzyme
MTLDTKRQAWKKETMTHLNRRDFLQHTVLGLTAGVLVTPGGRTFAAKPARRKPNIIYVLTDQWRAQATGYGGDPNVKTPNLDALATRSINFENAVSVSPVCTPHRASLLTGRYPLSTGMFMNDLYLPGEELCMAEIFKEAGYDTGYIGKWHLDGHGRSSFIPKNRRQGFDYWKVLECTHNYNASEYYAADDKTKRKWKGYDAFAQTKDAQNYIRKHAKSNKPFLLMVAYGTPHFPHGSAPKALKDKYPVGSIKLRPNVPEKMKRIARREAQGYYAHCTALDGCVGDLQATLTESGADANTIFVFTSDHGEMLGSQGQRPCEKQRPWDESIRVPFLLRYPAGNGAEARTVQIPINTPDILPTLLSLAGIKVPDSVEGEDLSRFVLRKRAEEDRSALIMSVYPFAGYYGGKAFRGIRTARYTYARSHEGPWLMYDNKVDPYQMKNLVGIAEHADLQKELERKLQAKLKQTGDEFLPMKQYLKAWGYTVDRKGCIPYRGNFKVQSPRNRPK